LSPIPYRGGSCAATAAGTRHWHEDCFQGRTSRLVLAEGAAENVSGTRTVVANMSIPSQPVCEIALVYPCDRLAWRLLGWARKHADCVVKPVFSRSLPEIRAEICGAAVAVVDATEDHAQAIDAFSQAVAQVGVTHTTVYTEKMHDGLELFVRSRGAQLLLGPLSDAEWEAFFAHALLARRRTRSLRVAA
jgi:hypothetical protein